MKENEIYGAFKAYGDTRVAHWVWWGELRETEHLEDLGVDGSIQLKRRFEKWDGGHRLD